MRRGIVNSVTRDVGALRWRMGTLVLSAAAWLCAVTATGASLSAQASRVVEVEGSGATRSEARENAVRNALTTVVKQFVIADRAVSADDVLQERVLSTMNGYVERFEVLEVRADGAETVVKARVTVSETDVRATIRLRGVGSAGQVDGTSLVAASLADVARREARERMVMRIITQLTQSVEFTFDSIVPTDDRAGFDAHFSYALSPEAVESALSALSLLADGDVVRCRPFPFNAGWVGDCLDGRGEASGSAAALLRASAMSKARLSIGGGIEVSSVYFSTRADERYDPERMADRRPGDGDRTFLLERAVRVAETTGTILLRLERGGSQGETIRHRLSWVGCGRYLFVVDACKPTAMRPDGGFADTEALPLVFLETGLWVLTKAQRMRFVVPREAMQGVERISATVAW